MIQAWIIRADQPPTDAVRSGADAAICGDCPLRRHVCYVVTAQAPLRVWRSYRAGAYRRARPADLPAIGAGESVRLGAYGDPAAVPTRIWRALVSRSARWTGYTHQWRVRPSLRTLCMASVETLADAAIAQARGWRTFRVGRARQRGEAWCVNARCERVQCITCPIPCAGSGAERNIVCPPHGSGAGSINAT